MKTSKDKAQELVEKYSPLVRSAYPKNAIECAKIAVDEIIEANPTLENGITDSGTEFICNFNYWQEVKNELNKML